jgi:hypothetical protein
LEQQFLAAGRDLWLYTIQCIVYSVEGQAGGNATDGITVLLAGSVRQVLGILRRKETY